RGAARPSRGRLARARRLPHRSTEAASCGRSPTDPGQGAHRLPGVAWNSIPGPVALAKPGRVMPHVPKTHTLPFRTPPQNDDRNPQRVRFATELEVFRARARQEETRLAASLVRSPAAPRPLANRSKEPERESGT